LNNYFLGFISQLQYLRLLSIVSVLLVCYECQREFLRFIPGWSGILLSLCNKLLLSSSVITLLSEDSFPLMTSLLRNLSLMN